jgi:hypothetical protein
MRYILVRILAVNIACATVPDKLPNVPEYKIGEPFTPPPWIYKEENVCVEVKLNLHGRYWMAYWCSGWQDTKPFIPLEI